MAGGVETHFDSDHEDSGGHHYDDVHDGGTITGSIIQGLPIMQENRHSLHSTAGSCNNNANGNSPYKIGKSLYTHSINRTHLHVNVYYACLQELPKRNSI